MRRHRRRSRGRDGGTENAAPQAPLRRKVTKCARSSIKRPMQKKTWFKLLTVGRAQSSCLNSCRADHVRSGAVGKSTRATGRGTW
eukprot:gene10134-biopygen6260